MLTVKTTKRTINSRTVTIIGGAMLATVMLLSSWALVTSISAETVKRSAVLQMTAFPKESRPSARPTTVLEEVQEVVKARNAISREHLNYFLDNGWREVTSSSKVKDHGIMNLDPNLIGKKDKELIRQLATNSLKDKHIENAHLIAERTTNSHLRAQAILALARRHSPLAQEALKELFDSGLNLQERRMVLGALRPAQFDDPVTDWLIDKLHAPNVDIQSKRQIGVTLILTAIREDGTTRPRHIPNRLLERTDEAWHDFLMQTFRTLMRREQP